MKQAPRRVALTRRVAFSSGHRFWSEGLSRAENTKRFGRWASPYNHGHNYLLGVTVEGWINPEDGMVFNIKHLDDILQTRVVDLFNGKSINDEAPPFKEAPPTLEHMTLCIWNLISGKPIKLGTRYMHHWRWDADLIGSTWPELTLPPDVQLSKIYLEESPTLYAELSSEPHRTLMTLTRRYEFAASHRLHLADASDQENRDLFGKCNNPAGHGHNYVLEVTVEGEPDPLTGMLVDLDELDKRVASRVLQRYDHKNLNVDVPELRDLNPTSENVAVRIFEILNDQLPAKLSRIRLQETSRNIFEVLAS